MEKNIHMVGIKGTGMTALAEILAGKGARITGSDVPDRFYTDGILATLPVQVIESFSESNIRPETDLVVYSSAYSAEQNPDLKTALELGIPALSYAEAIGALSRLFHSCGIAGVHGKTTTTALAGTILKALSLPVTVIAGAQVPTFNYRSTLTLGNKYLVAETCEYRRHFLNFKPDKIVLTSVEMDHPDYFNNIEDLYDAFTEYILNLPRQGMLIYNSDDNGNKEIIRRILSAREDLQLIPYGQTAHSDYKIEGISLKEGKVSFSLQGFPGTFHLAVPGLHSVQNAAGALALCTQLLKTEHGSVSGLHINSMQQALASFKSSCRRAEVIGEAGGILFLDDYAHHPTAIAKTLEGLHQFYPQRRIILDFMAHTYSRTKTLLSAFTECFIHADEVVFHKIYASAREKHDGSVTGQQLQLLVSKQREGTRYFHEIMEAAPYLQKILKPGDLFVTMGAGDNWKLGQYLFKYFGGTLE